jgi:ATP-dependent protease ClpP protease subunit
MLIDRHIGFDPEDGVGIDGASFQQELLDLDNRGYSKIKVYINSPGGVVMDGYNIFNAILRTKTPVDTYNVGIAASIAGVIFMAGRKRIMADYAQLMMHNPFGGSDKKQLDAMRSSLCTMLASRSNISEDNVAYMMDRTTWMGPAECLDKGFCTDVEVTNDHNRKYMPANGAKAMWKASNKILNSIFNTSNMENISSKATGLGLIANYLDLNVDATENSVLTAVKTRINGLVTAKEKSDEELEKMKKKLDKMKEEMDELQKKYDQACKDAKDSAEKAEKEKKEAEEKAKAAEFDSKKATAKVEVTKYADAGRIKKEDAVIEKWVNLWVADAAGTKEMLEAIPLNKQATTIQTGIQNKGAGGDNQVVDPNVTPASSMHYMARVQANVNNRQKTA